MHKAPLITLSGFHTRPSGPASPFRCVITCDSGGACRCVSFSVRRDHRRPAVNQQWARGLWDQPIDPLQWTSIQSNALVSSEVRSESGRRVRGQTRSRIRPIGAEQVLDSLTQHGLIRQRRENRMSGREVKSQEKLLDLFGCVDQPNLTRPPSVHFPAGPRSTLLHSHWIGETSVKCCLVRHFNKEKSEQQPGFLSFIV